MQLFHLDSIIPVLMGGAILWLVARGLRWFAWLAAGAITLIIVFGLLAIEHVGL